MNLLTPSFDLILVLPVFYSSMLFVPLPTGRLLSDETQLLEGRFSTFVLVTDCFITARLLRHLH